VYSEPWGLNITSEMSTCALTLADNKQIIAPMVESLNFTLLN